MNAQTVTPSDGKHVLLLTDDPKALAISDRLAAAGYHPLVAVDARNCVQVIDTQRVDMLVSALRLGGADSVGLLQELAARFPQVPRLLLIHASHRTEKGSAMTRTDAFAAVTEPWDAFDVVNLVGRALHERTLESELQTLRDRLHDRGGEDESLGSKAAAAPASARRELLPDVAGMRRTGDADYGRLVTGFVELCAGLVALRDPTASSYSHAVADHSRILALRLGVDDSTAWDVMYAGLLHHIGKLGLPDHLFTKPYAQLSDAERAEMGRYPEVGAAVLAGVESLQTVANIVRQQNARFDGRGQPGTCSGAQIPLGSRILTVVKGYYTVQRGGFDGRCYGISEAKQFLRSNSGGRYDPAVVGAYLELLDELETRLVTQSVACVSSGELVAGMVLARDLLSESGIVLLSKDRGLDEAMIRRIRILEKNSGEELIAFVRAHEPEENPAPQAC